MLFISLQVWLWPFLLVRTLYITLVLKKTICTLNLHIVHAGVLISFCSSPFFFIFFYFLVSARMSLAKRSSCRAISCSWAATRLAFLVIPFLSFQFLSSLLLFLWPLRSYVLQFTPPGTAVKMISPPTITFLLIVNLSFPCLYDNEIWWAHPFKQKASYLNKMLKALSHQEVRRQSRKQVREGREGKIIAVGEWGGLRR